MTNKRIAVVGGMNLDLLAAPDAPLIPRDSTPGVIVMRPGGVGRNIAARLSEMGAMVSLITALGSDERAAWLAGLCRHAGIDLSLAVRSSGPAPCYLCIHDHTGDMALAVNDMRAMDALTPDALADRLDAVNAADGCVLDANLPEETLRFLAERVTVPLILDPVSCRKAARAAGILARLAAIKPNRLEAAAITGTQDVRLAADRLRQAGVRNVFISLGAEGVYFAGSGEEGFLTAQPLPSLPVTGAGDAMCAGLTLALLAGKTARACAQAGLDAAHAALMRDMDASVPLS